MFAEKDSQLAELDAELAAADRAGAQVSRQSDIPLPLGARGAVVFANQAQFRPTDYLRQLAERLALTGAQVYEGVTVSNVETQGQLRLETDTGNRVTADAIVLATHAPFQNLKLQLELAQSRSYVVSAPIPGPLPGLFWDLADPYHYLRSVTLDGRDYAIVGGGDHRTGTIPEGGPDAPFRELEAYAARHGAVVSERWSAQVVEPSDGLPFIGKPDAGIELYLAQGFSGNGMTFGTLSAMLISDTLLGRTNRYADLYRADRFKALASAAAVLTENAETAAHLVAGHLKPVSDQPVEQLPRGEGCILKADGKKLAVYRDDDGAVHAVSALCTHQGCQVAFNPVERSWDCPCHGSRFDIEGRVLDGPAKKPLEKHKDGGDDFGVSDQRYDAQAPATGTSEGVDGVDALEQGGPIDARVMRDGDLGRREDGGLPPCAESSRCATFDRPCRHQARIAVRVVAAYRPVAGGPCLGVAVGGQVAAREGNHVATPGRVRSEYAVEAHQRVTRRWDQGAESRQKLNWAHHAMRLATARVLDSIGDAPVREHTEALEAERRSGTIAE